MTDALPGMGPEDVTPPEVVRTEFPPHADPDDTSFGDFQKHVLAWMNAANDWHEHVDDWRSDVTVKLAVLDARTRDHNWVKWGAIGSFVVGLLGLAIKFITG